MWYIESLKPACLPSANDQVKEVVQRNSQRFLDSLHDTKLNNASDTSTGSTHVSIHRKKCVELADSPIQSQDT
jgi:hypothetical protein